MIQCCSEALAAMDLKCEGHPVPITCTFGAAEDDGRKMSLIEQAQRALQEAKLGEHHREPAMSGRSH